MEQAEVDHINRNLLELCDKTICNSLFLAALMSADVLGKADNEEISEQRGNINKAMKLYEIITQRENAYPALIKALEKTRQTGAVKILKSYQHAGSSSAAGNQAVTVPSTPGNVQVQSCAHILVGEGQCTINAILREVLQDPSKDGFLPNWRDLALLLDIPALEKDKLANDLMLNKKGLMDVLEAILVSWQMRNSSQATLESLTDNITKCGAPGISNRLRQRFS